MHRSLIKGLIPGLILGLTLALPVFAETPADLNDLQMAHVGYTADNIDIQYAHLALALSTNATVRAFAATMVSDHTAVNDQALALLAKLGAQPEDNFLSQALNTGAAEMVNKLAALRGADFDRAYAANELAYHIAVNDIVGKSFVPNIENAELKDLYTQGLMIFEAHQAAAQAMVEAVK